MSNEEDGDSTESSGNFMDLKDLFVNPRTWGMLEETLRTNAIFFLIFSLKRSDRSASEI